MLSDRELIAAIAILQHSSSLLHTFPRRDTSGLTFPVRSGHSSSTAPATATLTPLEPFPLAKKPVATIAILTISTISILMQYYSTYGFHYVLITEYFKISTEIESKSRNGGSISTLRFFTVETPSKFIYNTNSVLSTAL